MKTNPMILCRTNKQVKAIKDIGYFNVDKDSTESHLVFNRTVGLKDTWGKINKA